jgi:N-acetylmuramoyl-L-alanine amidase CwlA
MHYTAGNGDTAKGNCQYFLNDYRGASAHFFVDETSVWQSVELWDSAWHCGDNPPSRNGATNLNSIGIEMCSDIIGGDYIISDDTVNNAAELVWYLLDLYPNAILCRHYDVTGKKCPMPWVDHPELWTEFQRKIKEDKPMTADEKKAFKALQNEVTGLKKKTDALTKALEKNTIADEQLKARVDDLAGMQLKLGRAIQELNSRTEVKWDDTASCPKWLKPTINKLVTKGYLKGDGDGLAITYEMARILVIEDRAGVFDE